MSAEVESIALGFCVRVWAFPGVNNTTFRKFHLKVNSKSTLVCTDRKGNYLSCLILYVNIITYIFVIEHLVYLSVAYEKLLIKSLFIIV